MRRTTFATPSTKGHIRYWQMQDLAKGKQVFMLTATPINNRLIDLQHLIEHFTQRDAGHFKETLGIHSLSGYFRKLEKDLAKRMGGELIERTPRHRSERPAIPKTVCSVRWSCNATRYVKQSQIAAGAKEAMFPKREAPQARRILGQKTYGKLLGLLEKAFNKSSRCSPCPYTTHWPTARYR